MELMPKDASFESSLEKESENAKSVTTGTAQVNHIRCVNEEKERCDCKGIALKIAHCGLFTSSTSPHPADLVRIAVGETVGVEAMLNAYRPYRLSPEKVDHHT